jgi:hypothetical protein
MSLWNPRKPLNQPPSFGRVGTPDTPTPSDYTATQAAVAHKGAQFDRLAHTKKYGLRAKVK